LAKYKNLQARVIEEEEERIASGAANSISASIAR
jgi:hypothetical protein